MYILQNCCEISDKPLFKGQVLLQDSTLGWVDICIFSRALPMKKHLRPYIDEKKIIKNKKDVGADFYESSESKDKTQFRTGRSVDFKKQLDRKRDSIYQNS